MLQFYTQVSILFNCIDKRLLFIIWNLADLDVLIIDNHDSFVHNLARYVRQLGYGTDVKRNNELSVDAIDLCQYSHIILSPGPCSPNEAGICLELVKRLYTKVPILGVCLGHQVIAQAFGATITHAMCPMHGLDASVHHDQDSLFQGLPSPLLVARYHSLIVSCENFPSDVLSITSYSDEDEVMSLRHNSYPIFGVQFHPESILTIRGLDLLNNFFHGRSHVL